MTGADICRKAMQQAMLLGAGQQINGNEVQDIMDVVNLVLNSWNADQKMVYTENQLTFTLTPNLNPHTIGPTGATFTVTQRPVSLEACNIIDTTVTPNVYIPCKIRDYQWQAKNAVPGTTATFPVSVYYESDWPNGSLYFWPVPTVAYGVALWVRVLLAELALTDTFSLPPGYREALELTVAEYLCPMFQQPVPPILAAKAAQARTRLWGPNVLTPRIATRDSGMPNGNPVSTYNWQTGLFDGGPRGT